MSSQPASPNLVMGAAEWGLLLLLAFVWGGTFFFGRIALSEWPPITVVFCHIIANAGSADAGDNDNPEPASSLGRAP